MRERATRALGLALTVGYAGLVVWLHASQPQSLAQVTGGLSASVGAYRVEPTAFEDGLRFFRGEQFVESRAAFHRADPAARDPLTQFYVAYSYYRQGWGLVASDDALFAQGLETVDRAIAVAPDGRIVVNDADLGLRSADELRAELEAGLTTELTDFNPLRVFRTRK